MGAKVRIRRSFGKPNTISKIFPLSTTFDVNCSDLTGNSATDSSGNFFFLDASTLIGFTYPSPSGYSSSIISEKINLNPDIGEFKKNSFHLYINGTDWGQLGNSGEVVRRAWSPTGEVSLEGP